MSGHGDATAIVQALADCWPSYADGAEDGEYEYVCTLCDQYAGGTPGDHKPDCPYRRACEWVAAQT